MTRLDHDWFDRPLPDNVRLGERTWLYSSFAFVHYASVRPCGLDVGHDTGLYYTTFFDLGPEGEVTIGNYCTLVGAIISTNSRVRIGNYVFVAHEVVMADRSVAVPPDATSAMPAPGPPTLDIEVGDDVWIGARAVLLAGARIGAGAIIGAGAVIDGEVPAGAIVGGNPPRRIGSVPPDATPADPS